MSNQFSPNAVLRIVIGFAAAMVFSAADSQTREDKLAELVRAQGLHEMFAQTLQQSKATAQEYGRESFAQLIAAAGNIEPIKRQKVEAALQRYLDRCEKMWKADELITLWINSYGVYFSENDISQMLTYYKSPVGVKDVTAAKRAMATFLAATNIENQRRVQAALQLLTSEVRTELGQ